MFLIIMMNKKLIFIVTNRDKGMRKVIEKCFPMHVIT